MNELVEWLRGVLDERERLARAVAGSGVWNEYIEGGDDGWAIETVPGGDPGAIIGDEAMAHHIAANDPATALAKVAADRTILDRHAKQSQGHACQLCWPFRCEVAIMAVPYAAWAGYREEWRP